MAGSKRDSSCRSTTMDHDRDAHGCDGPSSSGPCGGCDAAVAGGDDGRSVAYVHPGRDHHIRHPCPAYLHCRSAFECRVYKTCKSTKKRNIRMLVVETILQVAKRQC